MAVTAPSKVCAKCSEEKSLDCFGSYRNGDRVGKRGTCQACRDEQQRQRHALNPEPHRWRTIRHRYGIEKEDYEALLEQQGGRCAICQSPEQEVRSGVGERYALHIDHDHATGEIRGLLCFRCNNGIGLLANPEALRAAAQYLEGGRTTSQ